MCTICGCSDDDTRQDAPVAKPIATSLHFGAGPAGVSVPGMSQERAIQIEADVLGENNRFAARNRRHFLDHGIVAYNLVSSPGSGKTTLLCSTLLALRKRAERIELGVIEGDQQTTCDADRIRATGVPAVQVNTGKGCHLDAQMIARAFGVLPMHQHSHQHDHAPAHGHAPAQPPKPRALLFIENVGNLVCPAMWDLGERAKVAILSVAEGEDKPLKYPDMFAAAQVMVVNKIDLLPYVNFDVERCIENARRINPGIDVLRVSAQTGEGMDAWLDWLLGPFPNPSSAAEELTRLRARVAELEARLARKD